MIYRARWAASCVAVALIALARPAVAGCGDGTQGEMNLCAQATADDADRQLNGAYARLEPTRELKTAERAWIGFRDAQCRYEAGVYQDGTMAPLVYSDCRERLAKARTAELDRLAQDEEYKAK